MPHLHVALVTERPEASLIPILQLRPQRIVLIPCHSSPQATERLVILLRHELPRDTRIEAYPSLPSDEPRRCAEYADALADTLYRQQFDTPSLTVTLDVGGCRTLIALLFQQALQRCAADLLYADVKAGAIYRLSHDDPGSAPEVMAIEPVLDIDRYLQANGRKRVRALSDSMEWRSSCMQRRSLTRHLAQHADRLASLLGELHDMVHGDGGVLENPDPHASPRLRTGAEHQRLHVAPRFPATDALTALSEAGLLEWDNQAPCSLSITSLEGAHYLGGGWLTEYAWLSAQEARLSQVCSGAHLLDLNVDRNDRPVVPSCLAVERNQLLFIECLIARPGAEDCLEQGLKRLHGMLNHSAGLNATRVLLACGEFDKASQRLTELQRIQGMHVAVVEGEELKHLPALLANWKDNGSWPEAVPMPLNPR
ncbi:MAG: DUF1887 family CARF protein [Halomonas sp.]|jgi:hypothetical protein|uniref:DUF1887 family protein n=1 Tax=Billgrantia tianxiuensis TaxID=2497861 RepID=A0A6I6SPQ9_9GAMM|nr:MULTISPECIES: DUF1887 family CARF protein [Halomonas]MCE8032646.1 DUF1887 family protein [Halomonas sp. MCCC 1A11057]MDX5434846.1 DUF1887 family CARF protein [Halomonas sp.]QHC49435.1 DUF1887 family protein [Halomonas tianxiuensis]